MNNEQKELEHLRKILGLGDVATRGYKTMVSILEQQIEFLDDFKLKSKIISEEKADTITYKNAKELWENLPSTIMSLHKLKNELGIEYVEKEDVLRPINSKSIANGDV